MGASQYALLWDTVVMDWVHGGGPQAAAAAPSTTATSGGGGRTAAATAEDCHFGSMLGTTAEDEELLAMVIGPSAADEVFASLPSAPVPGPNRRPTSSTMQEPQDSMYAELFAELAAR